MKKTLDWAQISCSTSDRQSKQHVWETGEIHTEFWWVKMREGDQLEDLDLDGKKMDPREGEFGH